MKMKSIILILTIISMCFLGACFADDSQTNSDSNYTFEDATGGGSMDGDNDLEWGGSQE